MRLQVAIAPTLLIAVVYRHRRGTELDQLNELVNVLQSIQLPFALLPARLMLPQCGSTRLALELAIGMPKGKRLCKLALQRSGCV